MRKLSVILLAILLVVLSATLGAAAERLGAVAAAQARAQQNQQNAANMGVSGPGSDLRRISTPKAPTTFTGLPAGVLPGDNLNSVEGTGDPLLKTVMSGEPLAPAIGPEMFGAKLDRLIGIASHLGYTLVSVSYSPDVMDTPYTYALMNGNRKVATLYLNRSMALADMQ